MTWTASGGSECTAGTGTYLFQGVSCAGDDLPTTDWPPNSATVQEYTPSGPDGGACALSGGSPYELSDGGVTHSTITYAQTSGGFSGTTSSTTSTHDGETSTCTYAFTAVLNHGS